MNQLDATERALAELFARQAEGVPIHTRAMPDGAPKSRAPRSARLRPMLVGAALATAVVIAAVAVGVWRQPSGRVDPTQQSGPVVRVGAPLHAHTDRADLSVDDYLVTAGGQRFTGDGLAKSAHSDPGVATLWTLELGWHDGDFVEGLSFNFTSDGRDWWVDEIRASPPKANYAKPPGPTPGDVSFFGEYFRSPLGEPFTGDLDLVDPATGVQVHMGGIRLSVSPQRLDCTRLARPYAVRDNFNGSTIHVDVGSTIGDELQVVDTAGCVLAPQSDRAYFTYVSQDPSIAVFLPSDCTQLIRSKCERGALPTMRGLRPGRTVISVTARDGASGAVIAVSDLSVVVSDRFSGTKDSVASPR